MRIIVSNNNKQNFFAVFGLLFGAVCWGIIWYPYRLMAEAGFSGVVSSFYTYSIAVLMGALILANRWRGVFALPKSSLGLCLAAGWTNLSYVLAVIDGEVMRVMLLFYLSPLWTLVLAHYWLKEPIHKLGMVTIVVSLTGALIMLHDFNSHSWPIPRNQAEWLALSSGMGFSLTNVMTRHATHLSIQAKSMLVWVGVAGMALVLLPLMGQAVPTVSVFNATQWQLMIMIAVLLMSATVFVQYGVTKITAIRASVLFLFELVVAAVASYYLANEAMTWNEWLGGSLIIAAALMSATQPTHHE